MDLAGEPERRRCQQAAERLAVGRGVLATHGEVREEGHEEERDSRRGRGLGLVEEHGDEEAVRDDVEAEEEEIGEDQRGGRRGEKVDRRDYGDEDSDDQEDQAVRDEPRGVQRVVTEAL